MKSIMQRAMAAEQSGRVRNASVCGGFPLADIPHVGLSAVIVADGESSDAATLLETLTGEAWAERRGFVFDTEPTEISIGKAKALDGGPIILVDHGDNTASGG